MMLDTPDSQRVVDTLMSDAIVQDDACIDRGTATIFMAFAVVAGICALGILWHTMSRGRSQAANTAAPLPNAQR
jgi:hypothetical protein